MEDATLQNLYIKFLPHYKMNNLIPWAAKCHHKFVLAYAMKANGGSRHITPLFLTLVLDEGDWSNSHYGHFAPSTHSIGVWVEPKPQSGCFGEETNLFPLPGI